MCPSSGLWGGLGLWFSVYHPVSVIVRRPQIWRSVRVCASLHLFKRAYCAQCSPSIPLWLASQVLSPAVGMTQSPLWIPVSHDQPLCFLSFLLVLQVFWAWCRSCFLLSSLGLTLRGLVRRRLFLPRCLSRNRPRKQTFNDCIFQWRLVKVSDLTDLLESQLDDRTVAFKATLWICEA